ncbi:helix-turn-helix domain protein [Caldicellulosiruptor owensensis OL]|uniref:Helix-turn-helix domain protein n=1 Tax=Caldicellulosiruptor owensensis (strain ATCC 700167 / DSM 13100 / OL) TaxID=632518 RepID=E4Q603_CALOW|nr:helix-turn-helix transcriptional regulator [Caldicellulosiruptor owensensis]ADQ04377.1 helix-turn-helix domain protein [Caldicellulosiruptor owensensis OL]
MRLKEIRKMKNLKQKEVAEKLQISPQRYCQYENGKRKIPIDIAIKIAQILNMSMDEIFYDKSFNTVLKHTTPQHEGREAGKTSA